MKHLIILLMISFSNIVFADFRFTYNNHTYDVITSAKTWEAASIEAKLKSIKDNKGYLVHINDELENQKISVELSINLSQKLLEQTNTFDAGLPNIPALWIGANDIDSEGIWKWENDNTQFWEGDSNGISVNSGYNNWGDVDGGAPFNYTGDELDGQDAGAFRLTDWVFGKRNQWDDVSVNNLLFYVVEYDGVENQENIPFFENGILNFPSVFVADASGCFANYSAELGLSSDDETLSFSLINAKLLSTLSICDLNVKTQASYQNGDLKLPRVDVSDGLGNFVPYEAELSLTPFSNPLSFELLNAQKLAVLPSDKKEIFSDFIIISDCNPAEVLPCTVSVEDKSTGSVSIDSFGWKFSDAPNVIGGGDSFRHTFNTPGVYQITHSVENFDEGLNSEISKEIVISIVSPSEPIPLLDDHPEQALTPNPGVSLTGLSSAIWGHNNISVCWKSIPAAESTFRIWVQNAVEASWEKHSALDFTGWGACNNSARPADIVIFVHDKVKGPSVNGGLGQLMTDMDLNFTFQNWGSDTSCNPNREGSATVATIAKQQLCIESIAVHEFGHAIGIAHEQNRSDTPDSCTDPAQGPDGDVDIGQWDIDSVMNYCNPVYNGNGVLSQGDIAGIQRIYPHVQLPPESTIWKIKDWCNTTPTLDSTTGYWYACTPVGGALNFRIERYESTAFGNIAFKTRSSKIVDGSNQCTSIYEYTSHHLYQLEPDRRELSYLTVDKCDADNVNFTYKVFYENDIRFTTYMDLAGDNVDFKGEFAIGNGGTPEWTYKTSTYDNEGGKVYLVQKFFPSIDYVTSDAVYPRRLANGEYINFCSYDGFDYYEDGDNIQYNDCAKKVKQSYFEIFRPIHPNVEIW